MAVNYPGLVKKRTCVLLSLLALLVLFAIIFAVKGSTEPGVVSAWQDRQADVNRPADADQKSEQKRKAAKETGPPRQEHTHPAFTQRTRERTGMVTRQIQQRGVRDPNVLTSLSTVPRHTFVRVRDSRRAYSDQPLPIGLGQTISQPYIVAYMTEALKLGADYKVLEIGTGSGYQAAVCAEIARQVYTIEILEELAESAKERLKKLGYGNVSVRAADGYFGWKEKGPFDAIIVTCAAGFVPPPLIEQLKPHGRMILPLGSPFGAQTLVLVTRDDKGQVRSRSLLPVRFVPMLGRITKTERQPEK